MTPVFEMVMTFNDKGVYTGLKSTKNLAAATDKAQESLVRAGNASADLGSKITSSMKSAVKDVIALAAAYASLSAAMDFSKRGVGQNADWEQSKIGIASVLASVREVRDEQGNLVTGALAYKYALGMAEDAMSRIKIMGLETTATSQDLVAGFQQLIGPASAAGLTMQQTLDFTMSMVQSLGAIGIPFNQLSAEARSLLDGTIVPTQDRLAVTLGITGDMVKNWKQQGILAQMLLEKMSAFAAAGDDVAKAWNGVTSNLQDAMDTVAMDVSKGLYRNLKAALTEVNDLLVDTKSKTPGISADFENIVSVLEQAQTAVGEGLLSAIQGAIGGVKALNAAIGERGALNAIEELTDTITILGAGLVAVTASRRVYNSEALASFMADQKAAGAIQTLRDRLIDLDVGLKQRVAAEREAAAAGLAVAQADLTRVEREKMLLMAHERRADALATRLIGTKNEERAEAVLSATRLKLTQVNGQLAISENAVATAQTRATAAAKGASAATLAWTGFRSAMSGVLGMFGGPLGLALTAGVMGLTHLATRQDAAARAADLHTKAEKNLKGALKDATGEAGNLTRRLTELEKMRLDVSKKQKESAYKIELQGLGSEIEKLLSQQSKAAAKHKAALLGSSWSVPKGYMDTLESMMDMLKSGSMSAEDFGSNIANLRDSVVDAGYANSDFVKTLEKIGEEDSFIAKLIAAERWLKAFRDRTREAATAVRAIPDSQIPFLEAAEAKAQTEKLYEKTSEAERQKLVEAKQQAADRLKLLQGDTKASSQAQAVYRDAEKALADFDKRASSSADSAASKAENATEKWKQFRLEIAALNGEGAKSAVTLEKQNKEIEDAGKAAGKSASEIQKMKDDYAAAFQGNTLKEFNKHVVELEGNTAALRDLKIEEEVRKWTTELSSAGVAGADLEGKITRLKDALAKQAEVKDAQASLSFIKEYSQLSGDFSQNQKILLEMLEREAEVYRATLPASLQPYIDKWQELKKLQEARDPLSGSIRGLRSYSNEAMNLAKGIEGAWTGGFTAMEDAMVKFTMTGKLSFQDMANSIISDLMWGSFDLI
ncbi:phage tail tape measure C-terminal domain-containing protein [Desulfovibrio falkowii]|uniref:Bacteriophage tail tape measure C-terminal domain-containing protein n=1 Tax=Desulfovibrio falkowii TaxID=3136602 RepID=A0ABQ0EA85_9BACT